MTNQIDELKIGNIIEVTNIANNQTVKFQVIERKFLGLISVRCIVALSLGAYYSDQFYFLSHLKQPDIIWSLVSQEASNRFFK